MTEPSIPGAGSSKDRPSQLARALGNLESLCPGQEERQEEGEEGQEKEEGQKKEEGQEKEKEASRQSYQTQPALSSRCCR